MFALCVFQIPVLLIRGPHTRRYTWFGYEGGLEFRKSVVLAREKEREERERAEQEIPSGNSTDNKQPEKGAPEGHTHAIVDEKRDDPATSV